MVNINIEYLPSINYSLINNGIAVCQSIEIRNESTEDIKDIILEFSGVFFQQTHSLLLQLPILKY